MSNLILITQAFPHNLKDEIKGIWIKLGLEKDDLYGGELMGENVFMAGEKLRIPNRLYLPNGLITDNLSKIERQLLDCIYLRHNDGKVREVHLRGLLDENIPMFVVPFIIRLIGEYVIELLEVIYCEIRATDILLYQDFIGENPLYWAKVKDRIISYWNEYYRWKFPIWEEYIGYQLIQKIEG